MSFWDGTRWVDQRAPRPTGPGRNHPFRDWVATIVMLTGMGLLVFPGMLSQAAGPALSATPNVLAAGDVAVVTARGFAGGQQVWLTLDGDTAQMPRVRTSKTGTFQVRVKIGDIAPGSHSLEAKVAGAQRSSVGRTKTATLAAVASTTITVADSRPASASPTADAPADSTQAALSATPTPVASATPSPATPAPATPAPATPAPATPRPTTAPTPRPAVPTGGAPGIPAGYGTVFRKDFSDGTLGPFRIITYPNDHPGDLMVQYGRFVSDARHISVHDGYLDLRCTRNADGTWSQAFVSTGLDGRGGTANATFKFQYGTARAMARMNGGRGAWQSLWYLVADSWGAPEIDWAEMIGGRLTANLHGSAADGQPTSLPAPGPNEWHEYGIVKQPGYIAFLYDGREVARRNVAMTASVALLADAKVGLSAPDASTPDLYLQVAWWTVDP